jgi:hypothetical protein
LSGHFTHPLNVHFQENTRLKVAIIDVLPKICDMDS